MMSAGLSWDQQSVIADQRARELRDELGVPTGTAAELSCLPSVTRAGSPLTGTERRGKIVAARRRLVSVSDDLVHPSHPAI